LKKIDLNVDIGEGFPYDRELLNFATSVNICCGEHAGSWELTQETIEMCLLAGKRIGAHPGFGDREGMGRRVPPPSITRDPSLIAQVDRFLEACEADYVKPHGAWYNLLSGALHGPCDFRCELRVIVRDYALPAMLLPSSPVIDSLEGMVIREGFADRRYSADGTLMSRTESTAILEDPDEIRYQVLDLATKVDSICLHGDNPQCLQFAELVTQTLLDSGYQIAV
jgi:UPF0271 protein